ncbi:hypothetical protein [Ferrimicrobium acidiphilum]|uniref:hypothetical protein n=1 Tax=Ferrimicrobium acidiphilum TaxID=121039 RepID=UPI0023F3932F|nr:hypothetical protein [Ferrimicrobium acidiphilum]
MELAPGITKNRKVLCIGGAAAAVVVAGSLSLMMPKSSGASELPGLSGLTPAKAAYLQQQILAQQQESASNHSTQSYAQGLAQVQKSSVPASKLPFPTGIQNIKQSGLGPSFIVSNEWDTVMNSTEYVVYCGGVASAADLTTGGSAVTTGAVEVWKNIDSGATATPQEVGLYKFAGSASSALKATSASESTVTLAYKTGTVTFDLANDSFLPSS